MPHQCVRCSAFYNDGAQELLKGCSCGARLFFFVKREKLEKTQHILPPDLSSQQKKQIEHDVLDLLGEEADDPPVILELESIRVTQPGKYELDLVNLFRKQPLIIKLEEGKYIIDIAETFNQLRKDQK